MKRKNKKGYLIREPKVKEFLGLRDDVPKGYTLRADDVLVRDSDGSEFVRVREIELPKNVSRSFIGTENILSGLKKETFNSFSLGETIQENNVKKTHCFWMSKYPISFDSSGFHSLGYKTPITNITFSDAKILASKFENRNDLKSYLPTGAEIYMLIKQLESDNNLKVSGVITIEGFFKDLRRKIYAFDNKDIIGTWTMETKRMFTSHVVFGGLNLSKDNHATIYRYVAEENTHYADVGFHVILVRDK